MEFGCGENFAGESGSKRLGLKAITGRQPIFSGAAGGVFGQSFGLA